MLTMIGRTGLSLNYQSPNASECYAVDYEYDENNRLLVETKTIDNEVETSTYYYDANGNLVEKINNAEGVLVSERRSYNGFGYLVCFQKGEKEVWYRYRPDGLRHSKQIIEDSENRVTTHFWDGQNIVLESSTNGSTKAKYIRGLTLIAQGIDSSMFYYLHNGHGDVVQRIDNYGNPLVSYEYDAFGNQLNQSDIDPNHFRYCGEYFDVEIEEIYLRNRYYDPSSGRFTQEDPIQFDTNFYTYCSNSPIMLVDPLGLANIAICDGGSNGSKSKIPAKVSPKEWLDDKKDLKTATNNTQNKPSAQPVAATGGDTASNSYEGPPVPEPNGGEKPYEPDKWNGHEFWGFFRRSRANCYNYALNRTVYGIKDL